MSQYFAVVQKIDQGLKTGEPLELSEKIHEPLNSQQKAVVAIKAAEYSKYAEEAKQRQREAGENYGRGQEKVPQKNCGSNDPKKGETREQLADDFGTNSNYVSQAIANH